MTNQYTKTTPSKEAQATLDALEPAAADAQRLEYAAHAARVKWTLLVHRARRQGLSLPVIAAAAHVNHETVRRICERPVPELHARRKTQRRPA